MTPRELVVAGAGKDDPQMLPARVLAPIFRGELYLEQVPDDFAARLLSRFQRGFLDDRSRYRANYGGSVLPDGSVRIRAMDFWTAINIGLNDVRLRQRDSHWIEYEVAFARWRNYCVILCASVLLLILAFGGVRWLAG